MKKYKKQITIVTLISCIILIIIGAYLFSNKEKEEIHLRSEIIYNFIVPETHYIDSSLINIPTTIPYEIEPKNIQSPEITIISSDYSVIKVNDDNTITALKIGQANLTLSLKENTSTTTTIKIIIE